MDYYMQVVPSSGEAQEKLALIQKTHLGYLQLDENNEKLQTRRRLEEWISSHLCTVPHKEKFPCPKFLEILRRTLENKLDFNAYKAAHAFNALEKYAVNLLWQPWRKEYRCIRLYGGFYQHNIESYLSNATDVLFMMGYEPQSKMEVALTEPIDPDRVIAVSLNCLIAAVEYQIMMQIMEKAGGCFTWQEIAYVRRHNMCDVNKAIHILMRADKRAKSIGIMNEKIKATADLRGRPPARNNGYVRVEKLVDVPCAWLDSAIDSMDTEDKYLTADGPKSFWTKRPFTNGYGLDSSPFTPLTLDEHIAASQSYLVDHSKHHQPSNLSTRDGCWGYVDQSLEHKGYNKDHGERGDLLKSGEVSFFDRGGSNNQKFINDIPPLYSVLQDNKDRCVRNQTFPEEKHSNVYDQNYLNYGEVKYYPLYYNQPHMMDPTGSAAKPSHFKYCDPQHVVREKIIPFTSHPQLSAYPSPRNLHLFVDSHHNINARQGMQDVCTAVESLDIKDSINSNRTPIKKTLSVDSHRSWYDNVNSDDGGGILPDMPSTDKVISHLGDPIVLPPPTPFRNDPSAFPSVNSVSSQHTHHRRSSDSVAEIALTTNNSDQTTGVIEKVISSEKIHAMGKPNVQSSIVEKRNLLEDKVDARRIQRKGSLATRHERSPSAGSLRTAGASSPSSSLSCSNKWNCWACTYLNRSDTEICEMCSRSRLRGAESNPLSSGGHECQQCTLVNEKGVKKCIVCGWSLENSPTYV